MLNSPLNRLISLTKHPNTTRNKPNRDILIRLASSFVPTTTSSSQIEPLPKPPSTNWFTTHPALSDSFSHLDSLIHRSRQNLHRIQILKRYSASADFTGTGIRSKWLKWKMLGENEQNEDSHQLFKLLWTNQIKWHPLATMSILVQANENRPLRMIEYNHLIDKLNELRALKKYLIIAKSLQLTTITTDLEEINELDSKIENELLKYSVPDTQTTLSKRQQLERDHLGRFHGIGRKKESTARAWMIEVKIPEPEQQQSPPPPSTSASSDPSTEPPPPETQAITTNPEEQLISDPELPLGKIIINGRSIVDYFHTPRQRATAIRALEITNCIGHYNVHLLVHGGGKMGQAAAASHAIANCLLKALNQAAKTDGTAKERFAKKVLVKSQLALRDPRVVERKKTGKPGAKSSYRWVKR
ncbi:37S ribosomal protein S9, mitochondrial [Puccinia graminis f. sp. tritici]|uniref:37S ribosomal protein S9, mitochondrial n=1 Tax=Puccinia graminis f. sp. tritici TaxID=56615 RepID=A0A5B0NW45_PUCGR|nr:37S ribosomal protein S9, mitochondrial [Puccinia graminis f. sp. tritici]KAA1092764.1 37S ribosomal protein S9, mitochondrial [Puccinia graminis f. sp. tritici]